MIASWVIAIPILLAAFQDDLPANWKSVTSTTGGFTVAMPAAPMEKKQKVETAKGHLQVIMLVAEGRNDSSYVVSFSDLPETELKKGAVDRRLDQARDSAISSVRGKLRREQAVELDSHPGRDITIEEKSGAVIMRMRIFLVRNRLYQVMVLGPGAFISPKEVGTFLDSFRLIK